MNGKLPEFKDSEEAFRRRLHLSLPIPDEVMYDIIQLF